jgi:uncharacterized iron-regulated protein
VLTFTACGTTSARPDPAPAEPQRSAASAPSTDVEHEPGIYDVATGEKLDRETFYQRLASATYVLVGESHPEVSDHAEQDRIYRAMLERHEGSVVLGLEMVARPYQSPLDAYVGGAIDEPTMLERVEWSTRWGYEAYMYAPMWRAAKRAGAPVVALNAPRELPRAVSEKGVDALEPAMKADLPELDLTNDDHRSWMRDIFSSHGMSMEEEKFERFYQAQVVWDETMADTAYRFMQQNPDARAMVVLAGRGHTEHDWGIQSRLRRRIGDADATVVTVSPMSSPAPPLAELREKRVADYVVFR